MLTAATFWLVLASTTPAEPFPHANIAHRWADSEAVYARLYAGGTTSSVGETGPRVCEVRIFKVQRGFFGPDRPDTLVTLEVDGASQKRIGPEDSSHAYFGFRPFGVDGTKSLVAIIKVWDRDFMNASDLLGQARFEGVDAPMKHLGEKIQIECRAPLPASLKAELKKIKTQVAELAGKIRREPKLDLSNRGLGFPTSPLRVLRGKAALMATLVGWQDAKITSALAAAKETKAKWNRAISEAFRRAESSAKVHGLEVSAVGVVCGAEALTPREKKLGKPVVRAPKKKFSLRSQKKKGQLPEDELCAIRLSMVARAPVTFVNKAVMSTKGNHAWLRDITVVFDDGAVRTAELSLFQDAAQSTPAIGTSSFKPITMAKGDKLLGTIMVSRQVGFGDDTHPLKSTISTGKPRFLVLPWAFKYDRGQTRLTL